MKEIEESLVLNMGTSLILGDFVSYGTWGEKIDIFFIEIFILEEAHSNRKCCSMGKQHPNSHEPFWLLGEFEYG